MRRALRWTGYVGGGLIALIAVAAAYVWAASNQELDERIQAKPERLVPMRQASLEHGQHLILTRGCAECHGTSLQGARFLDDPKIATIYATNLTRVARTASDQELARAIRQGIGRDGRPLLVMPSESYSALTDAEVSALIKAIRVMPAGGSPTPPPRVGPLGRIGIVNGKLKTAPALVAEYRQAPLPDLGARFAGGRHIAVTVCTGCHGSTLSGKEPAPGTIAPDLTMAGAYDLPAFTRLMRTGLPPSGRELKMMTGVSRKAFRHFTDEEIAALHAYLVERAQRAP